LLAYVRRTKDERSLVVLNLGGKACGLSWDALGLSGRLLLSTHLDRQGEVFTDHVALRPNEGVIVEL
jgi:alpha-glucosidase